MKPTSRRRAAQAVAAHIAVTLNANQREALERFVMAVGVDPFRRSALRRKLNAGDYAGAEAEFGRWTWRTKAGKKVNDKRFAARRAEEAALFALAPAADPAPVPVPAPRPPAPPASKPVPKPVRPAADAVSQWPLYAAIGGTAVILLLIYLIA
jgi:hypothetical protein